MKLLTTMTKNLKLLFRNRESAYTIVFGPLLIILLVSFAFMGSDEVSINLGVYIQNQTDLAHKTVGTLNEQYTVSVYPDEESCVSAVKRGLTHACIEFQQPEDGTVPVLFNLDFSRMDLVYRVIDDLSEELGVQADVLRAQLAGNALLRMETSAQLVEDLANMTGSLSSSVEEALTALDSVEGGVQSIPTEMLNITDIKPLRAYQLGLATNAQHVADQTVDLLKEALRTVTNLREECDSCPKGIEERVDLLKDRIDEAESEVYKIVHDTQPKQLEEAQLILRFAIEDMKSLESTILNVSSSGAVINNGLSKSISRLEKSVRDLNKAHSRLLYIADFLRGQEVSPKGMSVPVRIETRNIGVSDTPLSFAYPYLLVLVIMFIGMLLSSMLVVTDKTSRAAFRNFTTPTSDAYHVFVSFLTAFLVLVVEVLLILVMSTPFVAEPLFSHFGSTLLLIGMAIVIFTFLGMLIGYLSRTQEAAMITSISVGSVLLFVSNLVIPVEGMASIVKALSVFNPYIVLSELLRRSMLYGVTSEQITRQLMLLGSFLILLIILTVYIQRRIKKAYFKQEEPLLPTFHVPAPLRLGARIVYNEVDLIDVLDRMTREEFSHLVPKKENVISLWVARELRNKWLARHLRTTSKERMILKLDKYLKRHGKRIKR